jgi:hypothetical protein
MVAVKPNAQSSMNDEALDSLFDYVPDPPLPKPKLPEPAKLVVNPLTCGLVDVADATPPGIDRMIECLQDIKAVKSNLDTTRKQIEYALEKLCDKSKKSNTHHIIGDKLQMTVKYPGRKFNNSGLKKLYESLSEQISTRAISCNDIAGAQKLAKLRDTFMRITEIAVNLKDFKLYEGADTAPPEYTKLADDISRLEEQDRWPSFKLPE